MNKTKLYYYWYSIHKKIQTSNKVCSRLKIAPRMEMALPHCTVIERIKISGCFNLNCTVHTYSTQLHWQGDLNPGHRITCHWCVCNLTHDCLHGVVILHWLFDWKQGAVCSRCWSFGMAKEFRNNRNASWADKFTNFSPTLFRASIFSKMTLEIHLPSQSGERRRVACAGFTTRASGSEDKRVPSAVWSHMMISNFKRFQVRPMSSSSLITAKSCKMFVHEPPIVTSSR